LNLDGQTILSGQGSDLAVLRGNTAQHPENTGRDMVFKVLEQLP